MNADEALELARRGELYPGVILHGATDAERRRVALELARTLLCDAPPPERPCGRCRHCRRIHLPEPAEEPGRAPDSPEVFHPDLQVLERDLKTSTSVAATKAFLRTAQVSPFEARGQVFVLANAETLTGEAANALLKTLEEPHTSAPRHFFLLAPSRLDLLPTLRSRSLSVFLGPAESLPAEEVESLADDLAGCLAGWLDTGSPAWLLAAAGAIEQAGDWSDPRAERPWALGARALVLARERVRARSLAPSGGGPDDEELAKLSRGVLAAAEDLLRAPAQRLRAIPAARILDGVLARRLAAVDTAPTASREEQRVAGSRGRR
jgi:hypothetical protein